MIQTAGLFSSFQEEELFRWVLQRDGESYRALDQRRTFRTELEGEGFFVKIHEGYSPKEFLKNLLAFKMPTIGAKRERDAILHLTKRGVKTMTLAAYGERGVLPFWQTSFLITEELTDCRSLAEITGNWNASSPTLSEKRKLIEKLATSVKGMHEAGVNHQDCYICHFLLKEGTEDLFVIDLHRAEIHDRLPWRWKCKDLSALAFSVSALPLNRLDYFRFLRIYYGSLLDNGEEIRRLCEAVTQRVRKIKKHTSNLEKKRGFL